MTDTDTRKARTTLILVNMHVETNLYNNKLVVTLYKPWPVPSAGQVIPFIHSPFANLLNIRTKRTDIAVQLYQLSQQIQ